MVPETEFTKTVSQLDEYITPDSELGKRFFPSLYFFPNFIRVILYSCNQAKKGIYDSVRWYNSSLDMRESLERAGVRMHFSGIQNLLKTQSPVVFVSNHMSTMETLIFPSIMQPVKKFLFVIKEELTKYPFFGPIAIARNPILVGRENPREDLKTVLEEGSKKIQEGNSVLIFPQRTRSLILDPSTFNSLGNKLAKRNNVPVIPIAVLTDAWENGRIMKEFGKINPKKIVHIAFGQPIEIKGNGSAEHQTVIEFISSKLIEWGRADLVG